MGEDMMPIIGAIYLEEKKIMDIAEMNAQIKSVTHDPEQHHVTFEGFRLLGTENGIQMTFSTEDTFFDRRLYNRLQGWKNYDRPRKRMCRKAARLRYRHVFFITVKRLERLMRRHKERARRRWIKTGYDPVWPYTEEGGKTPWQEQ